jgi:SNF2 family DNA or RNA helicase
MAKSNAGIKPGKSLPKGGEILPWRVAQVNRPNRPARSTAAAAKRPVRVSRVQDKDRKAIGDAMLVATISKSNGLYSGDDTNDGGIPWNPAEYQIRACEFLLEREGAALWLPPGLRKTSCTLAAIKTIKEAGKLKRALVIAPLRPAQLTWPAEVKKWTDFHDLSINVLHGTKKNKLLLEDVDINVINPEGLSWLFDTVSPKKWPWNILAIDEATKFKSWSAKRVKLLKKFVRFFEWRWELSGTPAPQGIEDLFSQVFLLDGGERLGQFIYEFQRRFMVGVNMGKYTDWRPKAGALEEIVAIVSDIVMQLRAEDYLELPPLTYVDIPIELPPEARAIYDTLEEDFIVRLDSGEVTAGHAGILATKLRQATNGCIYDENRKVHLIHTEKEDALLDLVEELSGEPLLVAVAFRSEVDRLKERLKKTFKLDAPYLGGGVTSKEANSIVGDWNKGKIRVLLAHPASASLGLNLQGSCAQMCWYGMTWNLEESIQMVNRLHRSGQTRPVIVHSIIAKNTMDAVIAGALRSKNATMKNLLDGVRNYRKLHL